MTRRTFRALEVQLQALLHRPVDLADRQLADLGGRDPARASPHPQWPGGRPHDRLPVRPHVDRRAVGRPDRRPLRQAAHSAGHPGPGDAPVAGAGRSRLPRGRSPARVLCGCPGGRLHVRLQHPGAPGVRGRAGSAGGDPQRRDAAQRADDRLTGDRPDPRRGLDHHRGLRMGLRGRRGLLPCGYRVPEADETGGAPPPDSNRPPEGPVESGHRLHPKRPPS